MTLAQARIASEAYEDYKAAMNEAAENRKLGGDIERAKAAAMAAQAAATILGKAMTSA